MLELQQRAAVAAHLGAISLVERSSEALQGKSGSTYRWAWIVVIGILVIAAAVAWVYCRRAGYRGFSGQVSLHRNGWNIAIGVRLGCY